MSLSKEDQFHFKLQLHSTPPYPCSYLPEKMACSQVVSLEHSIEAPVYSRLIHKGFRRSGMYIYRAHCQDCHACVSLRIPVASFVANRTERRTQQRLQNLRATVMELNYSPEHYDLYCKYQNARHRDGGMVEDTRQQYEQFLLRSSVKTCLVEFRECSEDVHEPGVLRMVAVIDVLRDGLSSVYTFYDTDNPSASYGTYGVLWQIEYAKKLKLSHVYLGYWVHGCPKMAYKVRFNPFELFMGGKWRFFDPLNKSCL